MGKRLMYSSLYPKPKKPLSPEMSESDKNAISFEDYFMKWLELCSCKECYKSFFECLVEDRKAGRALPPIYATDKKESE